MRLTDEQKAAVAAWFAGGASLDEMQKRIAAEFGVHVTYLDRRLFVADLPQPEEVVEEDGGQGAGRLTNDGAEFDEAGVPPAQGDAEFDESGVPPAQDDATEDGGGQDAAPVGGVSVIGFGPLLKTTKAPRIATEMASPPIMA